MHNATTNQWVRFREYHSDELNGIRHDLEDFSDRHLEGYYFVENTTRLSGQYGWFGTENGAPSIWRWAGDRWVQGVAFT